MVIIRPLPDTRPGPISRKDRLLPGRKPKREIVLPAVGKYLQVNPGNDHVTIERKREVGRMSCGAGGN